MECYAAVESERARKRERERKRSETRIIRIANLMNARTREPYNGYMNVYVCVMYHPINRRREREKMRKSIMKFRPSISIGKIYSERIKKN